MATPQLATFDLVALHYGSAPRLDCPFCRAVFPLRGPKWRLVWRLTQLPAWRELAAGYRAVMVADDDLEVTTCSLNRQAGRQAAGSQPPKVTQGAAAAPDPAPGSLPAGTGRLAGRTQTMGLGGAQLAARGWLAARAGCQERLPDCCPTPAHPPALHNLCHP